MIEFSIELGKVICVPDPAEAAARDAAMIAAARDAGRRRRCRRRRSVPGCLAAAIRSPDTCSCRARSCHGGRRGRFDDVVGRGFTLLSPAADPLPRLDAELAAFFTSIGGIGAHVAPGGPFDDVRGSYARWFRDHGVGVVLQRPDFHVFGTGSAVEDGSRLVRALRSTLEGRLEASTRNH